MDGLIAPTAETFLKEFLNKNAVSRNEKPISDTEWDVKKKDPVVALMIKSYEDFGKIHGEIAFKAAQAYQQPKEPVA